MQPLVSILGGGLAGSEAARVLSAAGVPVRLSEMRPRRSTPAHATGELAEIVCSNSLGSVASGTGKGLLLEELRRLGSLVVATAEAHAVPAGASLAVDREAFARTMTLRVTTLPGVEVVREEVTALPAQGPVIVATGPLTSDALSAALAELTGSTQLYFYDAIAPIVTAESLDHDVVYAASRWGRGAPDFLNVPLTEAQYDAFVDALLAGEAVAPKDFEREIFFEGCMPIEEMARRGRRTLAFGPMRPVGLDDPRTGRRPFAVVQLRREDAHGQLYNLVGFQTKLKYGEQARVFRMLPGLERAEFARLGSIHRNTFLNAPALLSPDLSLSARDDVFFGGLVAGTEGYAECAALGLMAGLAVARRLAGRAFRPPPETTAIGSLMKYLREADPAHFQPMNCHFGLMPPPDPPVKGKRPRREVQTARALADLARWAAEEQLDWLAGRAAWDDAGRPLADGASACEDDVATSASHAGAGGAPAGAAGDLA
ncbi:MAG: methylenetetrahydrofolate--tRNA-(uracil(54)-C(5))-methyltransferase (FADH(2)-oxidizing) TrmFO [Planctomycetes bacterium]|nr:methylenetetrahydrofolate--tRNA-(uracil(54)-C(5))-methyltransferase (FADH(2)-oxidizing) TrmFO [Planctomycetota bacterium]